VSVSDNNVTPQCNEVVLESVLDTVHICETDVLRSINKLQCNKSCGPDEVPPNLIKRLKHCLCKSLSIMFYRLVSAGVVHEAWHDVYIVPIFKKVLLVIFLNIARYYSPVS